MPQATMGTRSSVRTAAVVSVLVVLLGHFSAAQTPAAKPGASVFPLSRLWTVTLDTSPALPPVYSNGEAYIALLPEPDTGHGSARLVAVSLSDGTTKWSRDVGALAAMTIGDGQVLACTGSLLQAFATTDGEPRWQLPLPAPASAPLHYEGGWLIVATEDSQAIAIRASDGAALWQVRLPSPAAGEPAISGDSLYLPLTDNRVVRLALDSGSLAWNQRILSPPTTVLALDDRVFVGTPRWFYALQPRDGKVLWRVAIGGPVVGAPAVDRQAVYFLALDNLLRALDRAGGSLRWRRILEHRERNGPLPLSDVLLVSGRSAKIQAYAAKDGAPAGSFDAPDDLAAPVHLVAGPLPGDFLLVALTGEGQMMALRPRSLQPEGFAVSPRVYLMAGLPVWHWW